jgi:hypothetical protein
MSVVVEAITVAIISARTYLRTVGLNGYYGTSGQAAHQHAIIILCLRLELVRNVVVEGSIIQQKVGLYVHVFPLQKFDLRQYQVNRSLVNVRPVFTSL